MNLQKLFETQRVLDEHIYEKHPELRGKNNLDWKILALQVELGECANEWRGFKKWSKHQTPRILTKSCKSEEAEEFFCGICHEYYKKDDQRLEFDEEGDAPCPNQTHERNWLMAMKTENPMLEEYVDCLHFILSIGLEMEMQFEEALIWDFENTQDVINLFHEVIAQTADLFWDCQNKHETDGTYKAVLNHFIKLGEELGFDWEQVELAYFAKNRINHERQESGY